MTPRLTVVACDICATQVYVGRHGDPLCTDACTSLRSHRKLLASRRRSDARTMLKDVRAYGVDAQLCLDDGGPVVVAVIGGQRVRFEHPEDLEWLRIDLQAAA